MGLESAFYRFVALSLLWVALACAPQNKVVFGSAKTPSSPATHHAQERAMFALLNRDRAAEGLSPLKYDERLADVARAHSLDMRQRHFFDHVTPNGSNPDYRLVGAGYLAKVARENLSEAPDVETSERGLLASPHHHENMMARDISHVGIGIVKGGVVDGQNLLFTQLFAQPALQESAASVERAVWRQLDDARRSSGQKPLMRSAKLETLARQQAAELEVDAFEASVEKAGNAVVAALSKQPVDGIVGLKIGAQQLLDSSSFQVPDWCLGSNVAALGLAVKDVKGADARPVKLLLLVSGLR
jgi:uncharacterized protein YkwD